MLSRKIISASISGSLFAIFLGLILPNPFGQTIPSIPAYLFSAVISVPVYLMYSFPAILIYGVIASLISDKASELLLSKTKNEKVQILISGTLHILFGLILWPYSLGASILFFITDRVLRRKKRSYTWGQAAKSLLIPVTVWLLFMGIVWLEHLINVN